MEVPCWLASGLALGFSHAVGTGKVELFKEGVLKRAWEPGLKLKQVCAASGLTGSWCAATSVLAEGSLVLSAAVGGLSVLCVLSPKARCPPASRTGLGLPRELLLGSRMQT